SLAILEGHINADHLDYFPYGCAYCGHWMTTEKTAHQHVEMKKHLPMKIKENLDWSKEERLKKLLETSQNGSLSREESISKSGNGGNSESIAPLLPTSSNAQKSDDGDNSSGSSSVIFEFEETPENVADELSGKADNRDCGEQYARRENEEEFRNKEGDTSCCVINERTYEESSAVNRPISLPCYDVNSTQPSPNRNPPIFDVVNDYSMGYPSTSAKKSNKHLRCLVCQVDVLYSLAANHIYSTHVADRHAVKCAYCDFGTFYAKSDVLRHVRAMHPYLPTRVIDRRKSHLRVAYNSYRSICFPNIGRNRRSAGVKARAWTSSSGTSVQSPQRERERSLLNNKGPISEVIQSSEEDQVECVRCQKKFDKDKIFSHLRDEHFVDSREFTCVGCSKTFSNLIDVQTHCREQHKRKFEESWKH
uniref:C2H2-type domain-containing protein n=1 Tax=Parascaris univalens TaxID=6257 RepID=A0A915CGV7_PARUN